MPNEIKAPKILKETIKQAYELMKAENLLLEFDRRTVLRLIIEAVTEEELAAFNNAKDKDAAKDVYKALLKKYHPDRAPEGKEQEFNQDFLKIQKAYEKRCSQLQGEECETHDSVKKEADEEMKKEQGQQAQGAQQDVQDVKTFLQKAQEKYHNLYEQMKQVIEKFSSEPKAFFEDQQFINKLVSVAQALNEQKVGDLGVEIKDGDLKGNIERIVAALEQIRKELLQALVKKGQLVKQNPPQPEEEKQELQENYRRNIKESIRKTIKKAVEANPETDAEELAKKIFDLYISGDSEKINAFVKKLGGTGQSEKYNKDMSDISKDQGINWFTGTAVRHKQSLSALVATMPNGEEIQASKEDLKATFDIIKASDRFVRIYELLFQLINKKISLDKMDLPKPIDLSKPPLNPRVDLNKITLTKPEIKKDDDVVVDDDGDGSGDAFNTDEFKAWYYDGKVPAGSVTDTDAKQEQPTLKEQSGETRSFNDHREDFTKSFTRIPMLQIQSQIFTRLYSEISNLNDENWLKKFNMQGGTDFEKDQVSQQIQEQQKEQVEFDENDIATFKEEYQNCLKIAKALNVLVKKLDKGSSGLETIGGSKIVDASRKIAQALQNSLAKVSQTISAELDQYVGKGGKLTEAPEKSPEQARQDANKAKRKKRGEKVVSVHRAVVGDLREIDQAVRSAGAEGIDKDTILNAAKRIQDQLDSIKKFFPSIAPFGKVVKDPDKMIKQLKIFAAGLVTDLEDFMDQLKSLTAVRGMNEQVEKRKYDTETIADFKQKIIKMSSKIQEYFDVKSDIPEVGKKKAPKVTNIEQAAAEGPGGDKAIQQGKAEAPQRQKEEESEGISNHSQAVTKLKSYENVLKDLYDDLGQQPGDIKEIQTIGEKAFTSALVVLLNNFPETEKPVQEEIGPKLTTPEGAGFKVFGLDKEKLKIINNLIKIDQSGGLSNFMYALQKDKIGATILKKRIDQKLKGISFNLDFNEIKKFYRTKEKDPQQKDDKDFQAGKKFGDKIKGMFKEEKKQEQLEKKLERLIEHYLKNRI